MRTSGVGPPELPPLQNVVDADALDALCARTSDDTGSGPAVVFS